MTHKEEKKTEKRGDSINDLSFFPLTMTGKEINVSAASLNIKYPPVINSNSLSLWNWWNDWQHFWKGRYLFIVPK